MIPVDELLEDHHSGHSNQQMDWFITTMAGGGHVYGMYKQALRELKQRSDALWDLETSRELAVETIEATRGREWRYAFRPWARRRYLRRLVQQQRAYVSLLQTIKTVTFELNRFHMHADRLKQELGDLTPERRDALEIDMWRHKIKTLAATDLITTGRLGVTVIDMMVSIPIDMRNALLAEIKQPQALSDWHYKRDGMLTQSLSCDEPSARLLNRG